MTPAMTPARIRQMLDGIASVRVGLIGDLCLDVYWTADMRLSELSRETPHFPLPVVEERFSPGGAGNVAANAAALGPAKLTVFGLIGKDWRGELLLDALRRAGADASAVVRSADAVTNTYIKPLRKGISDVVYEDPRIDFENRAPVKEDVEVAILESLEAQAGSLDVLLVSDQMKFGCVTPRIRERICALGQEGLRVVVDSRDRIGLYHHVVVKPNEIEAGRATGEEAFEQMARKLARKTRRPAVVTVGEHGCYTAGEGGLWHIRGIQTPPPIDIVGAGDTFLSALGSALGTSAKLWEAACLANIASSVTIRKVGTTGTATREEILSRADDAACATMAEKIS